MPPLDKPKSDPLIVLLDEIELLSAQTRLMELYLKRAHTAAFGEVEKIQEQFRAKVTSLKARLEGKEESLSKHLALFHGEPDQPNSLNQELLQRIAEQQNLLQRRQEESEQRAATIATLQERLSRLEATKGELESTAALRLEQARQELKLQVAQLESELAQKEQLLHERNAAAGQMAQDAQARVRSLAEELAHSRESVKHQRAEIQRAESERQELSQRVAQLESAKVEVHALAQRDIDALRQDAQAKIAALQSEIAHKTSLLTRNQNTIADLERELKTSVENSRSEAATQQAYCENQAAEIARRDAEIAALGRRIAELESAAQQQQRAAVSELTQARKTFAAELEALRAELTQKQQAFAQGQGDLQHIEHELRNRNRELQGKLAAKEAVVESLEHNLRQAQIELLAARDALGEKERTLADWQQRLTEKQQLIDGGRGEIEQTKADLATALERLREASGERSALQERDRELTAQVAALADQLNDRQRSLDTQSETLRHTEAQLAELCAALGGTREALDQQQIKSRRLEEDFAARVAELQAESERKEQIIREHAAAADRAEPARKAQLDDLESRLSDKERMLEARAREIGVLQARVESLSGQTARLEATHRQALEDAAGESNRARQALHAELTALQFEHEKQIASLHERQAAQSATEQTLRAQIAALTDESTRQRSLLDKQSAELRQAETAATDLLARIAELERVSAQPAAAPAPATEADRIAALELQLQSRDERLAELEATLRRSEQQLQSLAGEPRLKLAQDQNGSDQSEQAGAAQDRINELLERLAQLEAARHTLQENATHELQQLRESFESRIAKLRMELAEKERTPAKEPSREEQRAVIDRLEDGLQRQIQDLQGQLAEKHSLLENRNEELIKVKAEMDGLQDYVARLKTGSEQEAIDAHISVELREEDAVDMPRTFINGSPSMLRPDPLQLHEAEADAARESATGAEKSRRFTHLEGRVRSWNPEPEKGSALGSNRKWNMGLFKRRWKA
jgi:chromosome segregation ATPase